MKNLKLVSLVAAALLALVGCGGGGGGAPSSVQLSGSAAKGILIGADVMVYSLAGGKKGSQPLATGKTQSDGTYKLDVPLTNDPVVIEVKANASTTMLDETQPLVDGQYPAVKAPEGLTLRSFATDASKLTVVRVNALTEMAVAVAESTGNLSLNSLIAGQQTAQLAAPEGVNPFTQEPAAKPADMDDGQLKFALLNAGLLKSVGTSCDLQCQIKALSKEVQITMNANGRATYTKEVEAALHNKKAAVVNAGAQALVVNEGKRAAVTSLGQAVVAAANNAATNATGGTTADPAEVVAANGLQGFVDAMREGFRVTETRLLKVEKELDERYKDVTLEGVSYIGNVLDEIGVACQKVGENLSCNSGVARGFSWTPAGTNAYTWASTSADDGRTSTGKVVVSVKNGLDTLSVDGRIVKGGKDLVTMTGVEVGLREDAADSRATINGTLQAMDAKGLVVALKFEGIDMKSVPRTNNAALADMTLKGGLTLEANNGDKLTGVIDLTMVEATKKFFYGFNNQSFYENSDNIITSGTINLKAVTATTNVVALDVSFKTSMPDYTKDESKTNYETSDVTLNLALLDNLFITFTEKSATYDKVSQMATIKSGTSEVQLTAEFKEAPQGTLGWCQYSDSASGSIYRCASEMKLNSTNANPYTATLTKGANGKTKGDVLLGSTKVGEFVNGILKINGTEVSLY
jgi:hypothetical protein